MKTVNVKHSTCTHYCGRATSYRGNGLNFSHLGNPHPVGYPCPLCRITHQRGEAVLAFKKTLNASRRVNGKLWRDVISLPETAVLGCFCKPLDCHCDVIIAAWEYHHRKS